MSTASLQTKSIPCWELRSRPAYYVINHHRPMQLLSSLNPRSSLTLRSPFVEGEWVCVRTIRWRCINKTQGEPSWLSVSILRCRIYSNRNHIMNVMKGIFLRCDVSCCVEMMMMKSKKIPWLTSPAAWWWCVKHRSVVSVRQDWITFVHWLI